MRIDSSSNIRFFFKKKNTHKLNNSKSMWTRYRFSEFQKVSHIMFFFSEVEHFYNTAKLIFNGRGVWCTLVSAVVNVIFLSSLVFVLETPDPICWQFKPGMKVLNWISWFWFRNIEPIFWFGGFLDHDQNSSLFVRSKACDLVLMKRICLMW